MITYAMSNYYFAFQQTPLSKVHVEKLTDPQLVKKFLAVYQPIAMFTTDRNWSLS